MKDYATRHIGQEVTVRIDRPLGSDHPKHGFRYDLNYGFVPGTLAPDGEEVDAYVIGIDEPLEEFKGKCVAVIHRTDDDDDKLVVVPPSLEAISDEHIRQATDFQERFFRSVIVRQ